MVFILKRHTLIIIYSILFAFLLFGVISTSGTTYLLPLFLFYCSLGVSYFIFNYLTNTIKIPKLKQLDKIKSVISGKHLFFLSTALILLHFIQLKGIPAIEASQLSDGDAVALVRANIAERNGSLFNYISSFLIHSILPFSLLILYFEKRKWLYYILLLLASFYGFALMQKSYILTIFLPIIIYSLINKKIINLLLSTCIVGVIIIALTFIANPHVQSTPPPAPSPNQEVSIQKPAPQGKLTRVLIGLKNRVMITPGKMVSTWFENIPKHLPYQGINGYSFVTKLKNIEHRDYGKEMYLLVKKDKAELKGTMNAASFMYEYSYFGIYGLILSGFMLALIFNIVELLFKDNFELKLAINLYSILILSSSSITTLIFSGGWGLIIFLSLFFLTNKQKPVLQTNATIQ